jgi:transposase-like protein
MDETSEQENEEAGIEEVEPVIVRHAGGRPSMYDPGFHPPLAQLYAKHGYTENEIALEFGISQRTLYTWKHEHEEFLQSISDGKNFSDDRVEMSLYERANGYKWKEEVAIKVKDGKDKEHIEIIEVERTIPPDPPSVSLWLRNRRPKQWRERVEIDSRVNVTESIIDTNKLDDETKQKLIDAYIKKMDDGE